MINLKYFSDSSRPINHICVFFPPLDSLLHSVDQYSGYSRGITEPISCYKLSNCWPKIVQDTVVQLTALVHLSAISSVCILPVLRYFLLRLQPVTDQAPHGWRPSPATAQYTPSHT